MDTIQASQHSAQDGFTGRLRIDSILLYFGGTAVSLDQVKFGWVSGDSDFSMSAYTGGGSSNLSAMGYGDLASNGWSTIGSYYNNGTTSTTAVNVGNVSSSYWLISALNPNLGGTSNTNYYGNDFFKLASVGGTGPSNEVPEPSTLLLLGGVLLITVMRGQVVASRRESGHALQA